MQYQPAFNIWSMPASFYKHIQPGQWVYAGTRDQVGRFMGVKRSGTVVVAWLNNARKHDRPSAYFKTLRDYAIGR